MKENEKDTNGIIKNDENQIVDQLILDGLVK